MADLDVTVSATGARQADGELAKLQQTTTRASDAAKRLRQETSASPAAMSRHAAAASQAAEGNRKIAQTADQAQRSVRAMSSAAVAGRIGQSLGRFGGPIGGLVGRAAGGFASAGSMGGTGIALGALGLAAAGAGLALEAFRAAAQRAAERAERIADIRQSFDAARKSSVRSADQSALGQAISMEGAFRALSGNGYTKRDLSALLKSGGEGAVQGMASLFQSGMSARDAGPGLNIAMRAARTGQIDLQSAIGLIGQNPGLLNRGGEGSVADLLSLHSGRNVTTKDVAGYEAGIRSSGIGDRYRQVGEAQGGLSAATFGRFASSSTLTDGIREQTMAMLDPIGVAMKSVTDDLSKAAEKLEAAAASQKGAIAEWLQGMKDLGAWIGVSNGSYRTQAQSLYTDTAQALSSN